MSSDCIVMPLDWNALTKVLVPAWIDVIQGRMPVAEFGKRFIRHPEELGFPEGELVSGVLEVDQAYLISIGWSDSKIPFSTEKVRKSAQHEQLEKEARIEFSNNLMLEAMAQSFCAPITSKLPERPGIQCLFGEPKQRVSWTKNSYAFLTDLYESKRVKEARVFQLKPETPHDLANGLGNLFLGERTFPALTIERHRFGYPANDGGPWLLGYLSPLETEQLFTSVVGAEKRFPDWKDDELYVAFKSLIQGCAQSKVGAACVHGDRPLRTVD